VNRQLVRVGWTAMALIIALIVGTTYWQTWARPGLASRQDNEIQRVAEFQVRRGLILAPSRVLARNRVVTRNGRKLYFAGTRRGGSPSTSSATPRCRARARGSRSR
jgi:hypothetical protein